MKLQTLVGGLFLSLGLATGSYAQENQKEPTQLVQQKTEGEVKEEPTSRLQTPEEVVQEEPKIKEVISHQHPHNL